MLEELEGHGVSVIDVVWRLLMGSSPRQDAAQTVGPRATSKLRQELRRRPPTLVAGSGWRSEMSRRRHTPAQISAALREAEPVPVFVFDQSLPHEDDD